MTSRIVAGFPLDRNRSFRKYRRSVKQGSMMLATIEAMADADPIWPPRRFKADIAAQASSCDLTHDAAPSPWLSGIREAE